MNGTGRRYRVHCIGSIQWELKNGFANQVGRKPGCGWKGYRIDSYQCECYEDWAMYCRALTPGPGCPRGVAWPCPRCKGEVTGVEVGRKIKKEVTHG